MQTQRKQFSRTEGLALVEEFSKSGLCAVKFCEQKRISYHTFGYWRKISKNVSPAKAQPCFLPVKLIPSQTSQLFLKVYLNSSIMLELPVEIDMIFFKQILEACRSCG